MAVRPRSRPSGHGRCALVRAAIVLAATLTATPSGLAAPACDPPPRPIRDLDLRRYYSDAIGSSVDAVVLAENKAALVPVDTFLTHVVRDADTAVRRDDAQTAACALAWLSAWAGGEAWLGRMATPQAEYQRKWDLAGVALAYLKVRPWALPRQRAVIEPWLIRFADAARGFFDDPKRRRNNHWYWLGLGVAATALATDSARHWTTARSIFEDATRDIGPDGTLALELTRGKRALHYHAFALTPLVVMAELAAVRGEDWYAAGDGALHRLVAATAGGLKNPALFDRLAKTQQDRGTKPGSGWQTLYARRFPGRLPRGLSEGLPRHRWLGGDVTLLGSALARVGTKRY